MITCYSVGTKHLRLETPLTYWSFLTARHHYRTNNCIVGSILVGSTLVGSMTSSSQRWLPFWRLSSVYSINIYSLVIVTFVEYPLLYHLKLELLVESIFTEPEIIIQLLFVVLRDHNFCTCVTKQSITSSPIQNYDSISVLE